MFADCHPAYLQPLLYLNYVWVSLVALGVLLITTSLASTRVSAGIITIFVVSILTSFISVIAILLDVLYVDVVKSVLVLASGALLCKQVVIQMFVLVL